MRIVRTVVALAIIGLAACRLMGCKRQGEVSPRDYWPGLDSGVFEYAGEVRRDGELLERLNTTVIPAGTEMIDEIETWKSCLRMEIQQVDGEVISGEWFEYHVVNDEEASIYAWQLANGPLERYPQAEVPLRTPLTGGSSWSIKAEQGLELSLVQQGFDLERTYTIAPQRQRVEVPAGLFEDCLLVRESGVTDAALAVLNNAGEVREAFIEVATDRWWRQGLGTVRTVKRERAILAADPGAVWAEWEMVSELVRTAPVDQPGW